MSYARSAGLISFYEGTGTDQQGHRLTEILAWGDRELEVSHNYIQTLFPLPEESGFQGGVPVVDQRVFEAFRTRDDLRENLLKSFKRILAFYGLALDEDDDGGAVVNKGPNYNSNPKVWNQPMDHNHLRITRIIRSLRVLGLEDEAVAFYATLVANSRRSSSRSREYWRRAAFRSLNIRPNDEYVDDHDLSVGETFLRNYELDKAKSEEQEGEDEDVDEPETEEVVEAGKETPFKDEADNRPRKKARV
ncbi:opioid growth factor receptor conserved region-domain-containing protein [Amylocarpus encephaloides]|uniref:Opioid growth factor receptor conserved region-domain-containing protein n=1 Tax=Amylocarpus encephaloides TaxID=45428 RepID=A0A9P7YD53_9HELO|nr:opioid growth factor receptor conserved region-domain-containing protein [Amylocarpus encephaloides]